MTIRINSDELLVELRSIKQQTVDRRFRWLEKPTGKPVQQGDNRSGSAGRHRRTGVRLAVC